MGGTCWSFCCVRDPGQSTTPFLMRHDGVLDHFALICSLASSAVQGSGQGWGGGAAGLWGGIPFPRLDSAALLLKTRLKGTGWKNPLSANTTKSTRPVPAPIFRGYTLHIKARTEQTRAQEADGAVRKWGGQAGSLAKGPQIL